MTLKKLDAEIYSDMLYLLSDENVKEIDILHNLKDLGYDVAEQIATLENKHNTIIPSVEKITALRNDFILGYKKDILQQIDEIASVYSQGVNMEKIVSEAILHFGNPIEEEDVIQEYFNTFKDKVSDNINLRLDEKYKNHLQFTS